MLKWNNIWRSPKEGKSKQLYFHHDQIHGKWKWSIMYILRLNDILIGSIYCDKLYIAYCKMIIECKTTCVSDWAPMQTVKLFDMPLLIKPPQDLVSYFKINNKPSGAKSRFYDIPMLYVNEYFASFSIL